MTLELFMLAVRALVIVVLLISGIAKLLDLEGSSEAMIGFGVPPRFVATASAMLPWLEIALAIGMIFSPTLIIAAAGTTLLFAVFTIGVARVTVQGENVDCHCFGQLSNGPVTWLTVARNVLLTAAAIAVLWWFIVRDAVQIWEPLTWGVVGAGLVVIAFAIMTWAILRLWQIQIELLERINELQAMIPARRIAKPPVEESFARVTADMSLTDVAGESVPVPSLHTRNRPTLLVFASGTCRSCVALLPDIALWQREFSSLMRIAVIGSGDAEVMAAKTSGEGIEDIHISNDGALATAFGVKAHPTALLVDHDGFVRSKPAQGGASIRRMINELRAQAGG